MKFHDIEISEVEENFVIETLRSGAISGRGKNTDIVEKHLESRLSAERVLMTTSGTHALEMAVRLSHLKSGDEVILPSYTFPSTANAVLVVGATPVLIPVDQNSLSISSEIVKAHVTSRTKAVIAVHYAGVCKDIDEIATYCFENNLTLIEDAAQAFGSTYKGKPLGTYGKFGCLSFHGTKNDVSGEGGALIIPNADSGLIEKAERLLEKGTDRMAFMRGDRSKYEWRGFGSSYVPSDLLMALLRGQLETFENRMEKRRAVVQTYIKSFSKYESKDLSFFSGFDNEYSHTTDNDMDSLGEGNRSNAHLFYLLFSSVTTSKAFSEKMSMENIPVRQHFMPLHTSEMGKTLGYEKDDMPFESNVFERLYRLPVHTNLTEKDIVRIINVVSEFMEELRFANKPLKAEEKI